MQGHWHRVCCILASTMEQHQQCLWHNSELISVSRSGSGKGKEYSMGWCHWSHLLPEPITTTQLPYHHPPLSLPTFSKVGQNKVAMLFSSYSNPYTVLYLSHFSTVPATDLPAPVGVHAAPSSSGRVLVFHWHLCCCKTLLQHFCDNACWHSTNSTSATRPLDQAARAKRNVPCLFPIIQGGCWPLTFACSNVPPTYLIISYEHPTIKVGHVIQAEACIKCLGSITWHSLYLPG